MKHDWSIGTGWVPEERDPRDKTVRHPHVQQIHQRAAKRASIPSTANLREWCGKVRFQGGFNTCNVHVVGSLLEYLEQRAFKRSVAPSRRFLFKAAKNFALADDMSGVYIRQVMGVLKMIGAPPEKYWPYPKVKKEPSGKYVGDDPMFHEEPTAFCYAVAADYQAIEYYRLDERDENNQLTMGAPELLEEVKRHLAGGVPTTLGFPLYREVIWQSSEKTNGVIAYPNEKDKQVGGHAVLAVGYDDQKVVGGDGVGTRTTGALLVQNSWGEDWGEKGFGWLAYEYVLQDRTRDFWTLLKAEWVDTGAFQLGI